MYKNNRSLNLQKLETKINDEKLDKMSTKIVISIYH
jgi:hypothetical protein